jgi:membrane associated rhomboid family serine protease
MAGLPFGDLPVELLHRAVALCALAVSLLVVLVIERPGGSWGDRLRSRLVLGVPWGTLVVVTGVVGFYLVVQHGWSNWYDPVTLPYRAWSLFSPLGWLTAAFAHSGSSHLVGNVTTALAVFPLAEYAYGHYPRQRGSQSFASWRSNPLVRALLVVPAGTAIVGLVTALFSWGPIIGFSGVVFAAIGFAAVRYPVGAVVAAVAQGAVKLTYQVLLDPILVRQASERYVRPGWVGIAVQGHALGLFTGVALGVLVFYRDELIDLAALGSRGETPPSVLRMWAAALLLALVLRLQNLWWYRGAETFVLYRGLGLAVVALVATLIAAAVASPDTTLECPGGERETGGVLPDVGADDRIPDVQPGALLPNALSGTAGLDGAMTTRQVAVLALLAPLVAMAPVAVGLNLVAVADAGTPGGGAAVEVRDYTVTYAEDVQNGMTSVVDVSMFGETTTVNTSGVIVVSDRRNIWTTEVTKGALASRGSARVVVGGPTWRETVFVKREGWSALGGGAAYRVRIGPEPGDTRVAYTSGGATAGPVLAGRNVSVVPAEEGRFDVRVTQNGATMETAPMPDDGENVSVGGVTFVRDGAIVEARVNDTRVDVFRKENAR